MPRRARMRPCGEAGPAGLELGEVVGYDELRRQVRTPDVRGVLDAQWAAVLLPRVVVVDAVEIRVQLEERAGGVAEVPVEVRAREVPAEAPGMAARVGPVERGRGVADMVDVVALP